MTYKRQTANINKQILLLLLLKTTTCVVQRSCIGNLLLFRSLSNIGCVMKVYETYIQLHDSITLHVMLVNNFIV